MRAVVKNGIGVFHPQGFLDGNNAPVMMNMEDINITAKLKVNMLLISLKKVIFFNHNGIDALAKVLLKLRAEMKVIVGFCDYDPNKYKTIMGFYKHNINFSLFQDIKVAELFSSSLKDEKKDILIYNEDPSQRSTMAIELFDHGHNPIVAQSKDEFNEKRKKYSNYYAIIEHTYLGLYGQQIATRVTGNAIIYTLSNFLDTEISTSFNIEYHTNSLIVGFRLFIFDAYKVISLNIHAMNFFAKLSTTAAEYNATIAFVGMTFEKTPTSFKNELEDSGIIFFDQMDDILKDTELLKELGASSVAASKNKRQLNKVLVNELPQFIDATISTIAMMTGAQATKDAAQIQELNLSNIDEPIASTIGFYGDIDGMIVLIFPKSLAKKSCELLLGEESDSLEEILDSLGEFVNIIGGRLKALLEDKSISVDITLPRTFDSIKTFEELMNEKKGAQVDLNFDQDKFILFLTK